MRWMSKQRSGEPFLSRNSSKVPRCWFFWPPIPSFVGFTLRLYMERAPQGSSWHSTHGGKWLQPFQTWCFRTHHHPRKGRTLLLVVSMEERKRPLPRSPRKAFPVVWWLWPGWNVSNVLNQVGVCAGVRCHGSRASPRTPASGGQEL